MNTPLAETYWVEPGRLLAGPYPGPRRASAKPEKLHGLLDAGINLFIDLTEKNEILSYTQWLGNQARHLRLPIADFHVPTTATMLAILNTLDDVLQQQRRVYIHCLGGIGRTGTVIGCYLVRHGLTGTEALTRLEQLRAHTALAHHRSPETDAQRQMILHWQAG